MATPTLEFTESQKESIRRLVLFMRLTAGASLFLGVVLVILGICQLFGVGKHDASLAGFLPLIQGAITAVMGAILMTSAADVEFMITTKYSEIHLGNAFENLGVFYKFQLGLASFLIVVGVLQALFSTVTAAIAAAVVLMLVWPALALAGTPPPREEK